MVPGSVVDALLQAAGLEGHDGVASMILEAPNKLTIVRLLRNEEGHFYKAGDEIASETLTDKVDWDA